MAVLYSCECNLKYIIFHDFKSFLLEVPKAFRFKIYLRIIFTLARRIHKISLAIAMAGASRYRT